MYKQIVVLAFLVLAANARVVDWIDCVEPGTNFTTVHELRVVGTGGAGSTNCETLPCAFVQGNTYNIQLDSTGHSSSTALPFTITATILGLPVNLTSGDACDRFEVGSCPTVPGQAFTFDYNITVPPLLPPVPAVVRSEVRNHLGQLITCVQITVQFVTSSRSNYKVNGSPDSY